MKEEIDPFAHATEIMTALRSGVLITTQAGGRINTMTIGWGFLGIDWDAAIFITLVRNNRFSYSLLQQNPQFTVNVPIGPHDRKTLAFAGTKSGRDMDKFAHLNLDLEEPLKISVPGIRQFPLTLECSVVYAQPQNPQAIPEQIRAAFHPQHVPSSFPGKNRDYHTVFYGAIVAAYIIR